MQEADWPPIVVKLPPAYTVLPLTKIALTVLLALGFQEVALLVFTVASNAAMRLRVCPPMVVKDPPAYTMLPLMAMALTLLLAVLAFGFHAVAKPVVASRAAMRLRDCPPMVVKDPPAYTMLPLTARALTVLLAFGFHAVSCPEALICAMKLRVCPATCVKLPPINHPPLPSATETETGPLGRA